MPDWCINTRCLDCESHAIIKGKIDCNYMNRLGLSQPTVKSFMETERTPEQVDKELEDLEKTMAEIETRRKLLEELKGKAGGAGEQ